MSDEPEIIGNQLFFADVHTAVGIKKLVVRLEGCGNVVTNIVPLYDATPSGMLLGGVLIFVAGDCKPVQPLPGTSNLGGVSRSG